MTDQYTQDEARRSHRRSRLRRPAYAGLCALMLVTGCGAASVAAGHGLTARSASVVKTETCRQQWAAWKTGPAEAPVKKMLADLQAMQSAANLEDIPETDADLKAAGDAAAGVQAYPVPSCADPAGYMRQALAEVKAGGDNAGSTGGLGGIILAEEPLKKVQPLLAKFATEVKRNTPPNR